MEHEGALLTEITNLRSKAHQQVGERDFAKVAEKFEVEGRLGQQMGRLLMLSENYPQLRSDAPMMEAQRTYAEVEGNIAAARRFYNASVAELSNAVQIVPGPLLAGVAGVKTLAPSFQTVDAARAGGRLEASLTSRALLDERRPPRAGRARRASVGARDARAGDQRFRDHPPWDHPVHQPARSKSVQRTGCRVGLLVARRLAEGNRLVVALPKSLGTGNLFEPPPFWKPAGGEILVRLERDIRAVLRMADTVIDLDFWAAGRKRDYTPAAAPGAPGYASVAGAAGLRRARAPCGRRRSVPSK